MYKKTIIILFILLLSICLVGCETDLQTLHEKYSLENEIKLEKEITKEKYKTILEKSLNKEKTNKYGTVIWHNFNLQNETTKMTYNFKSRKFSKYKLKLETTYNDGEEVVTRYIKNSRGYFSRVIDIEGGNKIEDKIRFKIDSNYKTYSVEEIRQDIISDLGELFTIYMVVDTCLKEINSSNQTITSMGIDEDGNYVIDTFWSGFYPVRLVFTQKYKLIYFNVQVESSTSFSCYMIAGYTKPKIKYPDLDDYIYPPNYYE